MENAKIQIEVHQHKINQNWVYAAIGLRGGFATKDYLLDGTDIFHGNYAFYNILFNYFRLTEAEVGLHYDVQRATAVLSFGAEKAMFVRKLNSILNNLLKFEYNAATFEQAKQKTIEGFANQYKDGAFRAKLKIFEYSELHKQFTLKRLIDELQSISFEEFLECIKILLVPGNLCVYILGDISPAELQNVKLNDITAHHFVAPAGHGFDPLLRNDAHITNIARENYNLSVITMDFLNDETTVFARNLIAEITAGMLTCHDVEVWSDALDTSIIFSGEELRSYKNELREISAECFDIAHKKVVRQYIVMLESMPEHFAVKAVNFLLTGVYMDQYLTYLNGCTFEMFCEICQKADFKLNEAQIILRKGSR